MSIRVADGANRRTVSGWRLWADALRAVRALAAARLRLSGADWEQLVDRDGNGIELGNLSAAQVRVVDRVAYVLPRVARRVPWRADCLVQALAARRWLESEGIATQLRLGGRTDNSQFDAHAWLVAGNAVVTGWDNADFAQFKQFGGG